MFLYFTQNKFTEKTSPCIMYAFQNSVPLRIRTPMGGKRGYGPTHSQSLEKFFVGIDNVLVIALSSLLDPSEAIDDLEDIMCPAVIIENKLDYGKKLFINDRFYSIKKEKMYFWQFKSNVL